MSAKKELTQKELIQLIKDACDEEAAEIFVNTGVDFMFDHYDPEVKAVVVRELSTTVKPVECEILRPLQKKLQEISKRLVVYILYEAEEEA